MTRFAYFIVILFLLQISWSLQLARIAIKDYDQDDQDDSGENPTDVHSQGNYPRWQQSQQRRLDVPPEVYCEPEDFHHFYIARGHKKIPMKNRWRRAKAGERSTLETLCLKSNGLPVTRVCRFNWIHLKAEWENTTQWLPVECYRQTSEPIISDKLNDLSKDILDGRRLLNASVAVRREVTQTLCDILDADNYKMLPADVHYASKILHSVAEQPRDSAISDDVLNVLQVFMGADRRVLQRTAELNATNSLLDSFESYMDDLADQVVPQRRCGLPMNSTLITSSAVGRGKRRHTAEVQDMTHLGVRAHISRNLSVFYINPNCANITGIAVYDAKVFGVHIRETKASYKYRFLYMNETTDELMNSEGLQVATFVPQNLWRELAHRMRLSTGKDPLIVLKVYAHDGLFVENAALKQRQPFSKVLSISIPGFKGSFSGMMPFILRKENYRNTTSVLQTSNGNGCGYWDYGTWVTAGVLTSTQDTLRASAILCSTNHLTQFSFLLGGSYRLGDPSDGVVITPLHERALDIISLVGCSLSILGLVGIWMTAALFPSWRSESSTKILLNLCVALTLQMVLFVFVNTDDTSEDMVRDGTFTDCIVMGAIMQYSILVVFFWMLIIAYLQFQRYVTVIGFQRPHRYILKSAIIAWGLPLLPTVLVACITPQSYIPSAYQLRTDTGICYPSGLGLLFGVVLPVGIVVLANLCIFIHVVWSITQSLGQSLQRSEKQMIIKQIRLSVLLFFLLGLSWIFGLLAFMGAGIVFSYLFCLTATIQGLVLFIFFVILDEKARNCWQKLFCPVKEQMDTKVTEMQSFTRSTGVGDSSDTHNLQQS